MNNNLLLLGMLITAATHCSTATAADSIRFDGMGVIKIGQSFDEVSQLLHGEVEPIDPRLRASPDCYHTSPTHSPGVTFMFQKELLVRIDLTKKPGQTNSGVKIGDTFSVLKRHYHDAELVNQNSAPEEKQVTIRSPDKKYAFRFYFHNSKIDSISGGQAEAVDLDEGCY